MLSQEEVIFTLEGRVRLPAKSKDNNIKYFSSLNNSKHLQQPFPSHLSLRASSNMPRRIDKYVHYGSNSKLDTSIPPEPSIFRSRMAFCYTRILSMYQTIITLRYKS
jgi:hypothetical protein